MKKSKLSLIAIISIVTLSLTALPVKAQSSDVIRAEVDRTVMGVDETLLLTVTVDATDGRPGQPALPPMDGFQAVGSSSGTQISLINGAMRVQATYQYRLQPTRAGDLVIDPISVTLNGQIYRTEPIALTVTQGSGSLQPLSHPPSQPAMPTFPSIPGFPNFASIFGSQSLPAFPSIQEPPIIPTEPLQPFDPAQIPAQLSGKDFFVEAKVDNLTPYQGEQIVYTFRLYQAVDLMQEVGFQPPVFTGLWQKQQDEQAQYTLQSSGRTYRVTELQTVLVPTVIGEVRIDAAELTIPDDFFTRGQVLATERLTLQVKPLPPNAPDDYQGAVGKFAISSGVDVVDTKVNEAITIKAMIEGQGNLETMSDPKWSVGPEWRAFESQASTSTQIENGVLSGVRTIEQVLVPTAPGNLILPAIQFSYFDPNLGVYQTATTQPVSVNVAPDGTVSESLAPMVYSEASATGTISGSLRPIKPSTAPADHGIASLIQQSGYWLLWGLPLLMLMGQFGWQRRQHQLQANVATRRSQEAAPKAKRALRQARRDPRRGDRNPAETYRTAGAILITFIAEKLNRPVSGLTQTGLADLLLSKGIAPELVERVQTGVMLSEMGSYAPMGQNLNSGDIMVDMELLIDELDKAD